MTYTERDERLRLQDLALRAKVGHWQTKDLMHAPYSRPRDLVPMPWRESAKPSDLRQTQGIPSMSPKTHEACLGRNAYALRMELGERAYAACTGRQVKRPRTKAVAPVVRPKPEDLPRAGGLVVLGTQQARDLGIQSVGYLD